MVSDLSIGIGGIILGIVMTIIGQIIGNNLEHKNRIKEALIKEQFSSFKKIVGNLNNKIKEQFFILQKIINSNNKEELEELTKEYKSCLKKQDNNWDSNDFHFFRSRKILDLFGKLLKIESKIENILDSKIAEKDKRQKTDSLTLLLFDKKHGIINEMRSELNI